MNYEYTLPNFQFTKGQVSGKYRGYSWQFHQSKNLLLQ
ncbi:MAG: hypothetical protein HC773_31510 [Scytonema sp. CRU_2_7]|nr:hypothetical protein [Scytonema sp. CRU_2_7]